MPMEKVSVTLPKKLLEQARCVAGAGGLSRFVAESLEGHLRHRFLAEAIAEWEKQYGPITDEELERASEWLP
ncbi:MAG: CopG family transcriptional regulator [Chloroflexota bacterium]